MRIEIKSPPMSDAETIDYNAVAAKFLLNTASSKAKAKSWLQASLPEEPELEPEEDTAKKIEIISDDEFAGIGAPKKSKVDVLANRQLANVNDGLRKTLLGKKAYGKFQQGQRDGFAASKPMPKQARRAVDDDSDEDEGKGRGKGAKKRKLTADEDGVDDFCASSKAKKRPLSYADEIIAKRANKKKAKGKT